MKRKWLMTMALLALVILVALGGPARSAPTGNVDPDLQEMLRQYDQAAADPASWQGEVHVPTTRQSLKIDRPVKFGGTEEEPKEIKVQALPNREADEVRPSTMVRGCSAEFRHIYGNTQLQAKLRVKNCVGGALPFFFRVRWYEMNVNDESTAHLKDTSIIRCHFLNAYCRNELTAYSHVIVRTSYVTSSVDFCVHDDDEVACDSAAANSDYAYADGGYRYPLFTDTRTGTEALFPGKPVNGWHRCADDYYSFPTCWRDPNFRDNLITYYRAQGWALPQPLNLHEAHHAIPLELGGSNSPTNGILIRDYMHRFVHSRFWRNFIVNRFWTNE